MSDGLPATKASAKFLDYVGLGLILMPIEVLGQRWLEDQPISVHQWTAAAAFMVFGAISIGIAIWWDKMTVTPEWRLPASLDAVAHEARTWLVAAVLVIFGVPITLVLPSSSPNVVAVPIDVPAQVSRPLAAPSPLSDDEKQFRFALRQYILADVGDSAERFLQLSLAPANMDSNIKFAKERDVVAAAGDLADGALRYEFIPALHALTNDADNEIGEMHISNIVSDIKKYYFASLHAQGYYRDLIVLSGLEINPDQLSHWLETDDRTYRSLQNVAASPIGKKWEISGYYALARDKFKQYLQAK